MTQLHRFHFCPCQNQASLEGFEEFVIKGSAFVKSKIRHSDEIIAGSLVFFHSFATIRSDMRIHRHRVRKPKFEVAEYKANEAITAPEVRVINEEGESFGVMTTEAAIALARSKEMDLVEVSPKANPPVCKMVDFGQFKYQKEKEARKQKAQSHEVEVKGVRLSLRIGDHDLETRHQQAKRFLERGDKVKIELVLRGREKGHQELAREVAGKFIEILKTDFPIRIEQEITYMAGRMTAIVGRA